MSEIILGIDLGTTFSAAAYVDDDGNPRLLDNAEGKKLTPSVVLVEEDGSLVVGEAAANQAKIRSDRVISWFKREMGNDEFKSHGLSAVELSAAVLRKLKDDAEATLGLPIIKAVITCPAYFSGPEVENTKKAGELAGFEVLEIVREPTAAAVYYGVENLNEGQRLMVFDLGGGTFDVTLLELSGGVFRPLGTMGDRQLGGHDFTTFLLEYVARKFSAIFGEDPRNDPTVHQMLYEMCESAKRDLARVNKVAIPCNWRGQSAEVEVDLPTLEDLIVGELQVTLTYCEQVFDKTEPRLSWKNIDKILLVGGSTRLKRVTAMLEKMSGLKPILPGEVDFMVAYGAAIMAKGKVRPRRTAVTPTGGSPRRPSLVAPVVERRLARHLGTKAVVWEGGRPDIVNQVIIPFNTVLPTTKTRNDFATSAARQPYFDIPIVEFDDIGAEVIQKTYRFRCVPETPKGSGISVTFSYDISGIQEAEAEDQRTGRRLDKERVGYQEPTFSQGGSVDIVFILDYTGSMNPYIDGVKENIYRFVDELEGKQVDWTLGFVGFGDVLIGEPITTKGLTTSVEEFKTWVKTHPMLGGGDEPESQIDGLFEAMTLDFRQACQTVLILITDASPHDPDGQGRSSGQFLELAKSRGAMINIVGPDLPIYQRLVGGTEGILVDIRNNRDMAKILDLLSEAVINLVTVA